MNLATDLRFALRRIARHPGYALGLVATLALGIAVCVAMYSVVHGVVVKGLDYPAPGRLLVLKSANTQVGGEPLSLSGVEAQSLAGIGEAIESAGYYFWGGATYLGGETPRMIAGIHVGGDFFRTLGVAPQLGRWLSAADGDAGSDGRIVLGHGLWQELFGGDPDVIGRPFPMDSMTATIVGVMPPGFGFPAEVGYWIGHDINQLRADPALYHNARFFFGIARLGEGVTPALAGDVLARHSQALAGEHGAALNDWRLQGIPLLDDTVGSVRPVLLALLLIALLALLVACANAVNLVALRGIARLQELGVQQALGASGGRLARSVFLETLVLGFVATAVGVGLAALALHLFVGIGDSGVPRAGNVALERSVLVVAAGFGLLASLAAAILPAWRLRRLDSAAVLRGGDVRVLGGGVSRLLPVLACAVSVGGLAAALLLAGSVRMLERTPLGYQTDAVLGMQLFRQPDPGQGAWTRELIDTLRAVPGVAEAATLSSMPLSGIGAIPVDVTVPGRESREPLMPRVRTVSGPVQDVLGMRLLRGRWLDEGDRAGGEPVAVVNRAFAERVFPGREAIGQTISLPPFGVGGERVSFRIVGVMADARTGSVSHPAAPELWLPDAQYWVSSVSVLLRAHGDPQALVRPAQEAIWGLHPQQGIYQTVTLAELRDRQLATPRFFARNAGAFAFLAVLLAAIGVHSVVAFQMQQRRREFALRLALGANARQLAARVLGNGYRLGLPAAVLGVGLGLGFGHALKSAVVGIEGGGGWAAVGSGLLLLAIVALACLRSMAAAARVQPMTVLRGD